MDDGLAPRTLSVSTTVITYQMGSGFPLRQEWRMAWSEPHMKTTMAYFHWDDGGAVGIATQSLDVLSLKHPNDVQGWLRGYCILK